jgi:hypothetical protein
MNCSFFARRSTLPIALLASALVAACGSSDTETQATSSSASGTGGSGASGGAGASGGGGAGATGGSGGGGGSDGTCHAQRDCRGASFCAAYELEPICGGEPDTDFSKMCTVDADCAAGGADQICDDKLCVIPHGGAQTPLHCRKGCAANADCGTGQACNASHHCEAAACAQPAECGPNFTCDAASKRCIPKQCMTDAECDDYCVNQRCSVAIGQCFEAVP